MRFFSEITAIALALTLLAAPALEAKPTPRPSPPPKKIDRATLPTCTSMRVSADQMRDAFHRVSEQTGSDKVKGKETFDEIGDELGCRWPEAGEEGGEGLIELLERGGGTTTGMKARPR